MNICVMGAGAWGTAMAVHLDRCGHTVTLVPRRFEQAMELSSSRRNADYLPEIDLRNSIQIGCELPPVLLEAEVIFCASPMAGVRDWGQRLRDAVAKREARSLRACVSLTKGLEPETLRLPTECLREFLPGLVHAALSGPTNALEVAKGKPTAMVLAGEKNREMESLQEALNGPSLRIYASDDRKGVELGACLKNVYAAAAGCCDGLGLGDNAKAALLTRALAEMVRIGRALGARAETFYGLSGFGDLVATANGGWSRNRTFGERIGRGQSAEELLANRKTVVESHRTAEAFHRLCREKNITAPILTEMYRIFHENKDPREALRDLMERDLKAEHSRAG